jgi:hypothetical protein
MFLTARDGGPWRKMVDKADLRVTDAAFFALAINGGNHIQHALAQMIQR